MYSLIAAMGNSVSSVDATAAEGAAAGGGLGSSLIMIALMVLVFYFLLIRPQKKRDKEAKDMMAALKKGDKIVTIGGIRGTVAAVTDQTVFVKVDDNVKIEFSKGAISSVLNKSAEKKEAPAKVEDKTAEKAEETKKEEAPAAAPAKAKKAKKAPAKKAETEAK